MSVVATMMVDFGTVMAFAVLADLGEWVRSGGWRRARGINAVDAEPARWFPEHFACGVIGRCRNRRLA